MTATKPKRYTVTQGINPDPDSKWFTAEVKPNGNMRRVSSKHLPLRETREEAEDDLVLWLARKVHTASYQAQYVYGAAYDSLRAELKGRRG